jgi:hypothetical protein
MMPTGPTVIPVGAPPSYRVEPFASCQAAEAQVQARLERGEVSGPDQLRGELALGAIVEQMGSREFVRFKQEQAALSQRLSALAAAPPAEAAELRRRDRALAQEERHMRHLLAQPTQRQTALREEILRRFATRTTAHFSYVVEHLPDLNPAPITPPAGRKRLRREPDVYSRRPTDR